MQETDYDKYRTKIKEIQKIVNWKDEERVGLYGCRELGKLERITIDDIISKSKNIPDGVELFIFGGLVNRGYTTHDVDMFIVNRSEFTKDDIDKKIKNIFSYGKGRLNRVYNLSKFKEDISTLKILIDTFDKANVNERKVLCDTLNPIIEIHSHCIKNEIPKDISECLAIEVDKSIDNNVLQCSNKKCILHNFKK